MDEILVEPILQPVAKGYTWEVKDPFTFKDDEIGVQVVPDGFVSDLGSIPRFFWNIIPPFGPATPAYLAHDFLYFSQQYERSTCDAVLLRLMNVCGVGFFTRHLVYRNVRLFGWMAWEQDAKKKEEADARNQSRIS